MLLNRSHLPWFWGTLLATLIAAALYIVAFHRALLPAAVAAHIPAPLEHFLDRGPRLHHSVGNSPLGLIYGSIAYAIFIFAVLLGVRKKFPLMRLGRAQTWLRAHIWLTTLTLPLVFMHAAFRFGGPMTSALMWLYLAVMVSGYYGLALQHFIPRLMKQRLSLETIFEQIPYLTQQLHVAASKMRDDLQPAPKAAQGAAAANAAMASAAVAAKSSGASPAAASAAVVVAQGEAAEGDAPDPSAAALLQALETDILPYLKAKRPGYLRLSNQRAAEEFFRDLRLRTAGPFQEKADQLASWCEERRQMDLQCRFQHWLHGWLLFHAPVSFLLVIMTGWHAVVLLFLY